MTAVCFYFQVHQPYRLKPYTFSQIGVDHFYEDIEANYGFTNRIADRCYLPANKLIIDLINKFKGKFKVAYSISGICLEQFRAYRPEVLTSFQELIDTGHVEILAETYYHSLASIYDPSEFKRQVKKHTALVKEIFGVVPTTFRNTELIYSNEVAKLVESMGYKVMLAEGIERIIGTKAVTQVFKAADSELKLLLRHYRLSDDIAFRFPDKNWSEYPLLAPKFASWLHQLEEEDAETINLFLDYETFGEHKAAETGIFQFMTYLPGAVLENSEYVFDTPHAIALEANPVAIYDAPAPVTWADEERDLSGWNDNNMQKDAIRRVYGLGEKIKASKSDALMDIWGKLQTSDHFYYMSTKYWGDGVRQVFSPYKSPYDAYINYMNVLSDFEMVLK